MHGEFGGSKAKARLPTNIDENHGLQNLRYLCQKARKVVWRPMKLLSLSVMFGAESSLSEAGELSELIRRSSEIGCVDRKSNDMLPPRGSITGLKNSEGREANRFRRPQPKVNWRDVPRSFQFDGDTFFLGWDEGGLFRKPFCL